MKNLRELPKLRDSLSYVFIEHARVEKEGNAIAWFDDQGETHVPAAALGVVLLGPGTMISHAAVRVLTESGCSIVWVGEDGVRTYAQGLGETRSARRLLRQAQIHADPALRAAVVFKMYAMRFNESLAPGLTLEQIRGKEGVRVRTAYARASEGSGVSWSGRFYDPGDWAAADPINRALSAAASCLYGVCHCAIVSAGYSTALGFVHTGKLLSFVYDVADLYRVDVIVPVAFRVTGEHQNKGSFEGFEKAVRTACRDAFREHRLLERVVADIDDLLRVSEADLDQGRYLLEALDEVPVGLWDPEVGEIEGGMNHGDDHP